MTNNYEVATVVELGKAQDVVLGEKVPDKTVDSLTGEPLQRFVESTNE